MSIVTVTEIKIKELLFHSISSLQLTEVLRIIKERQEEVDVIFATQDEEIVELKSKIAEFIEGENPQ